ncbi:MAG: hypothetical protein ACOYND_09455 [Bacteroidota bacterium]
MKYLVIFLFIFVFNMQAVHSEIIDVNQVSEYTIEVTTGSGKSNLPNIVNGSCKLSGFNTKYIVVSCSGITIRIFRENGESVTTITNAIDHTASEPTYVSNVTEKYIVVKYKNSNTKKYYDFDGTFIKSEN